MMYVCVYMSIVINVTACRINILNKFLIIIFSVLFIIRGGVKVEEFDIDLGTELQSKESAQVVPEKPPETNEYSSVEPKVR